ncbi:MAG: hypothetical protein ACREAE_04245, partial [Nitrosopumilaceae archaeon]
QIVMSLDWIITGMVLFGGMAAAGISLWIKRRKESQSISDSVETTRIQSDVTDFEEKDNEK